MRGVLSRRRGGGTTVVEAEPQAGYYVSPGGSDANPGTLTAPWQTLAKARDAAPDVSGGTTVWVRAGAYLNFKVQNKLRANMLTFKAYPGEQPVLQGYDDSAVAGNEDRRGLYVTNSSFFRFEGFLFTHGCYCRDGSSNLQFVGNEMTGMPSASYTGVSHTFRECYDTLHEGNHFHLYRGSARMLGSTGAAGEVGMVRWTIRGNEFEDAEFDACTPYWGTTDLVVEDNHIHDITRPPGSDLHTDGLQIAPQSEGGLRTIVRRNLILRCHQGCLLKDGLQTGLILENNVVMERASSGPSISIYNSPGARIVNNTCAQMLFRASNGYAPSTDLIVENNIVAGTMQKKTDTTNAQLTSFASDRNNVAVSFLDFAKDASDIVGSATFVNAASSDYRLAAGSLGVDGGYSSAYTPSVDRNGATRPVGGAPDCGAYERQVGDP